MDLFHNTVKDVQHITSTETLGSLLKEIQLSA